MQRVGFARVTVGSVAVGGETVGEIGPGLLVFLGVGRGDGEREAEGNKSLQEAGSAALVVSQFTLYADLSRGNRPSYTGAAPPAKAERLYLHFAEALRGHGVEVATGRFGADMKVGLLNDGPVTVWLEQPASGSP